MYVVLASESAVIASETLFVLALIVIAGPLLAEKARLPGLIGFMLGGTLLGPHVLGLLEEGQFDSIGALGILYLMFLAGLELDMDTFNRYRAAAGQFGLLTFLFPFVLGWMAATLLDYEAAAAVLLGSIWASHTLVSLPIVKRAGLSGSRTVAVGAGATIITDTLALVVLAIISSGAVGGEDGSSGILLLAFGLVGLMLATLWLYPRVGNWFFSGPGTDRTLRFMFLIGAMALAGLLSEAVGIEGIVGAFFAGLGLNRLVPKRSHLMEQVEFVGSSLFVPAFLIMVGTLIDPAVLFDLDTLRLAGVFILVVGLGKGLATVIVHFRFRFSWAEVGLLFSLTIGQAAATLAAALVGFGIGLLDEQTLSAVVLTVLATILAASLLTRLFAGLVEPDRTILHPIGSEIVIPIRANADNEPVLTLTGKIARADTGTVTALLVIPAHQATMESTEAGEALVKDAANVVRATGAEADGVVRVDGSEETAVVNVVAEKRATMVCLPAPRGSTVSELVFGSAMEGIGGSSPVPVILASRIPEHPARLVVTIPGRPRTLGDQVDTQVALDVLSRLTDALDCPVLALIAEGAVVPDLPSGATIERTPSIGVGGIRGLAKPGDLIIAPLTSARRLVRSRSRELILPAEVGLLITAGPYRLRSEGSDAGEVATVLGYAPSGA